MLPVHTLILTSPQVVVSAMDFSTTCMLKMVCKSNRVQEVMLTLFKEEVKTFIHGPFGPGRNSSWICRDVPEVPVPPVNRCRMKRGSGRCRGTASELALMQMCAYHQERHQGYLNVDGMRCIPVSNPGLSQYMCAATLLTGQPTDVNIACGEIAVSLLIASIQLLLPLPNHDAHS